MSLIEYANTFVARKRYVLLFTAEKLNHIQILSEITKCLHKSACVATIKNYEWTGHQTKYDHLPNQQLAVEFESTSYDNFLTMLINFGSSSIQDNTIQVELIRETAEVENLTGLSK